jgi:nitrogen fixation protein NifB
MNDISKHPCFNGKARHLFGRIHLPVAPLCNMLCNFCNRKFDCMNESHPGVTSAVLTPPEALQYLRDTIWRRMDTTVVGFAGPGDPFANPEETMETLRLVRREFPEILLCIATNGLALDPHIEELARLQVSHVTITVNAIDPEVGARIYAWIRSEKKILRGKAAAELLWMRQEHAIRRLKACGIVVKINSIIIPGINDHHIPEVAKAVANLGADILNCMPMAPVAGSCFENLPAPESGLIEQIRQLSSASLPQMNHCARCRADAAGLIHESAISVIPGLKQWVDSRRTKAADSPRSFVAVASYEGALVNQHLGEAERLMIYQKRPGNGGGFELKEFRPAPPPGSGDDRWIELATILKDCRALLVASAGPRPQKLLSAHGLRIIEMEGFIEEGLAAAYSDSPVSPLLRRKFTGCSQGVSCRGTGEGCG